MSPLPEYDNEDVELDLERQASRAAEPAPKLCADCGRPKSEHSKQNQWCPDKLQRQKYRYRPMAWNPQSVGGCDD